MPVANLKQGHIYYEQQGRLILEITAVAYID